MMYNIVITNPAENDLYDIGSYISKELLEPKTAQRVISKIADAVTSLENMPHSNALVNDPRLAQMGIRVLKVDNDIIFYSVAEKERAITIIRVLYSRRNWKDLL